MPAWVVLALATAAGAGPEAVPPTAIPPEVLEVARAVAQRPLADRIDAISALFLGRAYVLDPTGEGAGVDPDPPARYDAFDCVTFAEEVLALALSGAPAHAAAIRRSLRYSGGALDYVHRNHFMELQWLPRNVEAGWLRDVTADLGPTRHLSQEVDMATWRGWGRRSLFQHADDELPVGTMALDVLPLEVAREQVERIAPGSLVMTVREPRPGVPLMITHVGIAVGGEGTPRVRHATKMGSGKVTDHGLRWYLDHIAAEYTRWPAAGIAVFAPREQGPRLSALPDPVAVPADR